MTSMSAVFYGVIQGLTEFLPVSSSGHLVLAQTFFGMENPEKYLTFDIFLHFGTLLAVVVIYFKDICRMIVEFFGMLFDIVRGKPARLERPYRKMALMIILATLPLFAVVPFKGYIEGFFSNSLFVGCMLLVTGGILWLADHQSKHMFGVDQEGASIGSSFIVGIFQIFATLPGISRSGTTISGGLLCGYDRKFAVKFSFLMSLPAVLGANILNIMDMPVSDMSAMTPYLAGGVAALVSGLFAIKLISYLAENKNFKVFSVYCIIVGIAAIFASLYLF